MVPSGYKETARKFEQVLTGVEKTKYILALYIAGMTPRSLKAIRNAKQICEEYLKDRYELEIIDIYQQPGLAGDAQIIAAPTLVKSLPAPVQKFIGDLSEPEPILIRLAVKKEPGPNSGAHTDNRP